LNLHSSDRIGTLQLGLSVHATEVGDKAKHMFRKNRKIKQIPDRRTSVSRNHCQQHILCPAKYSFKCEILLQQQPPSQLLLSHILNNITSKVSEVSAIFVEIITFRFPLGVGENIKSYNAQNIRSRPIVIYAHYLSSQIEIQLSISNQMQLLTCSARGSPEYKGKTSNSGKAWIRNQISNYIS